MTVAPDTWPEATDYFRFYSEGRHDRLAKVAFIYSSEEVRESKDGEKLYIGRAGADGIEFVYRRGSPDIWAYYPIDGDLEWKAENIEGLERAWKTGALKV
ncbi:hypothetical protein [Silicimonas sp. MF1-12-2]|uniref:hypothetical protein n=1 Tax=Silicimonas sp. MF1-12-2 TaxID=3384793 RepID=UPI0039B3E95B